MKVLLVNGSPHAKGSTYTALKEVALTLEKEGIETEILQVGHQAVRGCIACGKCREIGHCVFDDVVNEAAEKFEKADGIVVGSPVYYASDKTMKVGAAVVSARRGGNTATFDQLNKYFTISGMPVVSSQYWNQVHGNNAEECMQDAEGLQTMRVLGRNMAFLVKSIALGKETYGLPETETRVATNFIR